MEKNQVGWLERISYGLSDTGLLTLAVPVSDEFWSECFESESSLTTTLAFSAETSMLRSLA